MPQDTVLSEQNTKVRLWYDYDWKRNDGKKIKYTKMIKIIRLSDDRSVPPPPCHFLDI